MKTKAPKQSSVHSVSSAYEDMSEEEVGVSGSESPDAVTDAIADTTAAQESEPKVGRC